MNCPILQELIISITNNHNTLNDKETWFGLWNWTIRDLFTYFSVEQLIELKRILIKHIQTTETEKTLLDCFEENNQENNWIRIISGNTLNEILNSGIIVFLSIPEKKLPVFSFVV